VLRGREPVERTAGQRHVLWVISHPESLGLDECEEADLVLVASERFAAYLQEHTTTPVEVFLQATDDRRFRPLPVDPRHAHDVAVVAKTRDVLRPIVADALTAGLRPAIYGTGWAQFVPPDLVVADYVPNEQLARVYSSVGVLLSDHWDTMRDWGFVSNRVFDALACGTVVISDDLPEVTQLFGDTALTYREPDELRQLVDAVLADPRAARERAAAGRHRVLASHTFDHRALMLLDALARHRLDGPPESLEPAGLTDGR
jgi:O-antigen biosynthesis protein